MHLIRVHDGSAVVNVFRTENFFGNFYRAPHRLRRVGSNPPPRAWVFRPHGSLPSLRTRRVRTMGGFFILRPVLLRRAPKSRNALIAKQARGMYPSGLHHYDGRVDWI